jgi:hypothetical protein
MLNYFSSFERNAKKMFVAKDQISLPLLSLRMCECFSGKIKPVNKLSWFYLLPDQTKEENSWKHNFKL